MKKLIFTMIIWFCFSLGANDETEFLKFKECLLREKDFVEKKAEKDCGYLSNLEMYRECFYYEIAGTYSDIFVAFVILNCIKEDSK